MEIGQLGQTGVHAVYLVIQEWSNDFVDVLILSHLMVVCLALKIPMIIRLVLCHRNVQVDAHFTVLSLGLSKYKLQYFVSVASGYIVIMTSQPSKWPISRHNVQLWCDHFCFKSKKRIFYLQVTTNFLSGVNGQHVVPHVVKAHAKGPVIASLYPPIPLPKNLIVPPLQSKSYHVTMNLVWVRVMSLGYWIFGYWRCMIRLCGDIVWTRFNWRFRCYLLVRGACLPPAIETYQIWIST